MPGTSNFERELSVFVERKPITSKQKANFSKERLLGVRCNAAACRDCEKKQGKLALRVASLRALYASSSWLYSGSAPTPKDERKAM